MPATPGTSWPAQPTPPAGQTTATTVQSLVTEPASSPPPTIESPKIEEAKHELNEKTQILGEAKACFMASSMKTKKLVSVLTKCIAILLRPTDQHECGPFTSQEATDLFFHVTRLFQYKQKDSTLRRLTHIAIKLLSDHVTANTAYVVTSSLTSDIGAVRECPAIRASAMRAVSHLLKDATILKALESYLEQCLLSKHPNIASAALIALSRTVPVNKELVDRYTNHVQYVLVSGSPMAQYHALALLYSLSLTNRDHLSQLINLSIEQKITSPLALCLLIRIISKYLGDCDKNKSPQSSPETTAYRNFLKTQLSSNDVMVEYEAAYCIISSVSGIPSESSEHKAACGHLRNFLTSSNMVLRFSSLRSLNELACTLNADSRFWSCHRIGGVCKLHLLNKSYRIGDYITGILDFTNSNITCAKYTIILQCEDTQYYELKQEFSLGLEKTDFMIAIPALVDTTTTTTTTTITTTTTTTTTLVLHCVLSFLFYIVDKSYPKTIYEDRTGTIELGPSALDTKLFSCDFPIAVHL